MANSLLWVAIILLIDFDLFAMHFCGLNLDFPCMGWVAALIGLNVSIALFYRYVRRDDRLCVFINAYNQVICASIALSAGSYIGAYLSMPLIDKTLIAIDGILGFDWRNYVVWLDKHPWLTSALTYSYNSYNIQFAVLLPALFYSQLAHGQRVFMALYFSGLLTLFLATLFPAVGAYVYYTIDPAIFHSFTPQEPTLHQKQLLALLNHTTNTINFPAVGIISFPSYHSAIAVALMYAALPYRLLLPVFIPLNVAMLISTPIAGAHYLTDILGGIAFALLGIYIAERILPREKISTT